MTLTFTLFPQALNMSSRVEMSLTENGVKLSVRDDAKTFQAELLTIMIATRFLDSIVGNNRFQSSFG